MQLQRYEKADASGPEPEFDTHPVTPGSIPNLPVEMVTTASRLAAAVQELSSQRMVSVDTESNSFHRYPERLCLIQLASENIIYVVDPLAVDDITPLGALLADDRIEKIIHSADYDIRSLDRQYGFRVRNLFDTAIAAQFINFTQLGLSSLLQNLLSKTLTKTKRLQRADWSIRPLTTEALAYASDDVRYLLTLREVLAKRLALLRRLDWVDEECARLAKVRYVAPERERLFLRLKGASALDPKRLAVLKTLAMFREKEALRLGRPPFWVLADKALVFLATNPKARLEDVPGLGSHAISRWGQGLRGAVQEGLKSPPVYLPKGTRQILTTKEQARLKALKGWRTEQAQRLDLDPPLLWPTVSLERLARAPDTLGEEISLPDVRAWQRDEFASSLRAYLESFP